MEGRLLGHTCLNKKLEVICICLYRLYSFLGIVYAVIFFIIVILSLSLSLSFPLSLSLSISPSLSSSCIYCPYFLIPKWMAKTEKPCLTIKNSKREWQGPPKVTLGVAGECRKCFKLCFLPLQSKPSKSYLLIGQQEILIVPWASTNNFVSVAFSYFFIGWIVVNILMIASKGGSGYFEYFIVNCSWSLWKFYPFSCNRWNSGLGSTI